MGGCSHAGAFTNDQRAAASGRCQLLDQAVRMGLQGWGLRPDSRNGMGQRRFIELATVFDAFDADALDLDVLDFDALILKRVDEWCFKTVWPLMLCRFGCCCLKFV